jgi:Domain of unknown function (DUF4430)
MSKLLSAMAVTVALATVTAGSTPANAVVVGLTVKGSTAATPLFEAPVDTVPHPVDGSDGSGAHACAGPPSAPPSPTATGALDDGLRGTGISWRGNWDPSFHDFFIDRIGPFASEPPDEYWSLSVNGQFVAGGCLTTVAEGDEIEFSYGSAFGAPQEDPVAPTQPSSEQGRSGSGRPPPATPRQITALKRVSARATRFLQSTSGIGEDWAGLALALRDGRRPDGAAQRLSERLRALPGDGSTGQDVDSSALVAWALALRGQNAKALRLAAFVRSAQSADGGFPTAPGGTSNAQSTGVALVALRVTGLGPRPTAVPGGRTPLDYLASLARGDGSIAYRRGAFPTPVWTTAQALLGLTGRAKLLGFAAGGGRG